MAKKIRTNTKQGGAARNGTNTDRNRAAYHEAGHAVVNALLGVQMVKVSMEVRSTKVRLADGTAGKVRYTDGVVVSDAANAGHRVERERGHLDIAWLISGMAGAVAEFVAIGCSNDDALKRGMATDLLHLAAVLGAALSIDSAAAVRSPIMSEILDGAAAEASSLLREHWAFVVTVAKELFTGGVLHGDDVERSVPTLPERIALTTRTAVCPTIYMRGDEEVPFRLDDDHAGRDRVRQAASAVVATLLGERFLAVRRTGSDKR